MTNVMSDCLNPIRPMNDGQMVDVQADRAAGGQTVEGIESSKIDDDEESRAEAEDDARKPKPAARPYTPRGRRFVSMK